MAEAEPGSTSSRVLLYPQKSDVISPFLREKYEKEAGKYWDLFYKRNADRFFKDRHYLDKEWGHYIGGMADNGNCVGDKRVLLEVGCGTGNTIFPLIAEFGNIFVHACDFSPRAVNLVKAHQEYDESRVNVFVCDATFQDLTTFIQASSVHVVTLVFMLSAVSPKKMAEVLYNIKRVLKPGGHILVRDYAVGDLAQERFTSKDQKISDNFFARGDGTRVYYFSEDSLVGLFAEHRFTCEAVTVHCREVENRSRALVMHRRWIQGEFCLPDDSQPNSQEVSCLKGRNVPEQEAGGESMTEKECGVDVDLLEGMAASLFGTIPTPEIRRIEVAGLTVLAKCLPKEYQHTVEATGLLLWDAAPALATVLRSNPSLLRGRSVLELGCGAVGLCSLLASMTASQVVATDGDGRVLNLLHENLEVNGACFPVDKVLCHRLEWGNKEDMEAVKACTEGIGFDVVLGTDVTYVAEAVPLLFASARTLLASRSSDGLQPMFLLCHFVRRVPEEDILDLAIAHGFYLHDLWACSPSSLASPPGLVIPPGLEGMASASGPLRLLCFLPSTLRGSCS